MNEAYQKFYENADETKKPIIKAYEKMLGEIDISSMNKQIIENHIVSQRPSSRRVISNYIYVIKNYARYYKNDVLYSEAMKINTFDIWSRVKKSAPLRLINEETFNDTYTDIGINEETNAFYTQTIFKAVWEGVYNVDGSIFKNLRAADLREDSVILRPDDKEPYEIPISKSLIEDLKELSNTFTTERKNRYGIMYLNIDGIYPDTCFKLEARNGDVYGTNYRVGYRRALEKATKRYLATVDDDGTVIGWPTASDVFISGIISRIYKKFQEEDIDVFDAFRTYSSIQRADEIIIDMLERYHYSSTLGNFKIFVRSYMELFD